MTRIAIKACSLAATLVFVCCSTSAQPAKPQAASDVVATIGGTTITLAQVDEMALQQQAANFGNLTLSQAMYEARRAAFFFQAEDGIRDYKVTGVQTCALPI